MLNVNIDNVRDMLGGNLIKVSFVYPMAKKSHFVLLNNIVVKLSNGYELIIPKGYRFDGSSSPRFMWWLFPSYGDFFFAALLHDYLYYIKYMSLSIGNKAAQEFADKEMLLWSNVLNNRNIGKRIDNELRYFAVRLFGKKVYKD